MKNITEKIKNMVDMSVKEIVNNENLTNEEKIRWAYLAGAADGGMDSDIFETALTTLKK